ncbi:MAG: GTPase [Firmicutes bacterium]|nr:GTPase [Bacillota bacterium]
MILRKPEKVVIMGAAGRDFHNFNTFFRDNPDYEVVAFTATQIPNIEGRRYPPVLAGPRYPEGIEILPEEDLPKLIKEKAVDKVVFAYSDVSHQYVMHRASLVLSQGPDFLLMGPKTTMLKAEVPVISVCAVRTGVGKSQTTRRVSQILRAHGVKTVVVRHPMPYGRLDEQVCQRFENYEDLDRHECTIEEREEYEPHIAQGHIVYAGVDYGEILEKAQSEAQIILWDGGNNDLPFYEPDLHIVLVDPHRPGHEVSYHPGETNLRMADIVIVNKVDTTDPGNIEKTLANVKAANPKAAVITADSPITLDNEAAVAGKRALVVEDGPTLTHGGMAYGAGVIAAKKAGATTLVDPEEYAVGSIKDTLRKYPDLEPLLPAMGYSATQISELEETIRKTPCDVVVIGTPIDLRRVIRIDKPTARARYELVETGGRTLEDLIGERLRLW